MRFLNRFIMALAGAAALCVAGTASAQLPVTTQVVRVYITSTAFGDIGEAEMRRRVGLLIADVNAVFAQQTRRRFTLDTVNDIHVIPPFSLFPTFNPMSPDTAIQVGITDDTRFGGTYSTGPNMFNPGGSISMTAVQHLHDPFNLQTEEERSDYLRVQMRGLVHEFEHTFGAGFGEYYELTNILDTTGVAPRIDVNYFETPDGPPTDPYWSRHQEYSGDPLMTWQYGNPRVGAPTTREATIAATRFTRGSLSIIDAEYAGLKPTMDLGSALLAPRNSVHVSLVDRDSGLPVASPGFIRVFQFTASLFGTASPFQYRALAYDPATPWTFPWPGNAGGFNFGESRVLVKAEVPGYMPDGTWFSIFDLWDQLAVEGRSMVEITIPMSRVDAPMPTIAMTAPAAGANVENAGNTPFSFDIFAAEGLREVDIETADGLPVCVPKFYGVGVTADHAAGCVGMLLGTTGDTSTVVVKVTDQSRRSSSQSYSFRLVDTVGPALTLFPSWGPAVLSSREPTQALLEYFDISSVDRYQLTMGTQLLCAASVPANDPGIAFCPWTAPRIADGTMSTATLTLTAWDHLGNVSRTSGSVLVDAQAPTLRVVSPAQNATVAAGTDVTFVVDAFDAGGMDSVSVVASGQTLCFTFEAPYACTVTIPADWNGGKSFHVTAFDAAGNTAKVEVDLMVLKAGR